MLIRCTTRKNWLCALALVKVNAERSINLCTLSSLVYFVVKVVTKHSGSKIPETHPPALSFVESYNRIRWDNRKFIYISHQKEFQRLPLSHHVSLGECDNQTKCLFPDAAFFQGWSNASGTRHSVATLTWVCWLNRLYDAQFYWYDSNPEGIKCL